MLAVTNVECRARAGACRRRATNERMPEDLREDWRRLAEMWEAWAEEADQSASHDWRIA